MTSTKDDACLRCREWFEASDLDDRGLCWVCGADEDRRQEAEDAGVRVLASELTEDDDHPAAPAVLDWWRHEQGEGA